MSDDEIDALTGEQLDAAVAEAMAPKSHMPTSDEDAELKWKWWDFGRFIYRKSGEYFPDRSLAIDGGNIMRDLLLKLREWDEVSVLIDCHDDWMCTAMRRNMSTHELTPEIAVARLFLLVCEARKGTT